jgi:Trk K+ transport system NAD-binding subunit
MRCHDPHGDMKALIVGAGGVVRELLAGLSDHWEITAVDRDAERLQRAAKVRDIETIVGDGSSKVVLTRAGIDLADAVIAASDDDDVNLEVCRLALAGGIPRIAAVARDPERLDEYRALKVPAFSRAKLTARRIEMQVEPRRVTTAAFADGLAEAIEFRVTSDAPVANRPLRDLRSERWLVAAVLRDGSLIVPHGDTVLRAGDLVTVVGAASDYPTIVGLFTSGQANFPLDIGRKVIAVCDEVGQLKRHVAEADALVRSSAAESLVVIHPDPSTASDAAGADQIEAIVRAAAGMAQGIDVRTRPASSPVKQLARISLDEGAGVIVLPSSNSAGHGARSPARDVVGLLRATHIPLLLAAGTFPYRRIVVPLRDSPSSMAAARAAIDLAASSGVALRGIAVVPPPYLGGAEAVNAARGSIARFREEAAVLGLTVDAAVVEGNPVRVIVSQAEDSDLLVVGTRPDARSSRAFARHLVRRVAISMLLVPDRSPDAP